MVMKYKLIICLLVAGLFSASCEKENGGSTGVKYISFSASVNAKVDYDVKATKADEGKFGVGEHKMGLWICNADLSPILNEFKNCRIEYTRRDNNSEVWKFYGGDQIWEDAIPVDDERAIKIYSYYPYAENVTDITAVPFTSGVHNYFYSEPVELDDELATSDEVEVALNYKPVMTCIEVAVKSNMENTIAVNEVTLTDVSGANIITKGTFNATNGEVTASDEEKVSNMSFHSDEGLLLTTGDDTPKISFIIPKYSNYSGNFKLSFKFNGVEGLSGYTIPEAVASETDGDLKEGKKYIITLQLNEEMKLGTVGFKTVADWNNDIHETDIQM